MTAAKTLKTLAIAAEHKSESRYSNDVINLRRQRRQSTTPYQRRGRQHVKPRRRRDYLGDDGSGSGQEIDGNGGARTLQRRQLHTTETRKKWLPS